MSDDLEWLDWQREHVEALYALQEAQRVFHRTMSRSAFAGDDRAATDAKREAMRVVDTVRAQLDEVRARQPR